ncbi:MAG: NAD-glutamate dehydrogenase [Gordonia sp. (in: high G+C Gram-positive bacteria)]
MIEHLAAGRVRRLEESVVSVSSDEDGLTVLVVAADAPLLIESVLTAVAHCGLSAAEIDHPVMPAQRDTSGVLTGVGDSGEPIAEAWIRVRTFPALEVEPAVVEEAVRAAVGRVGAAARDADRMREALTRLTDSAIAPEADRAEYRELIQWLARGSNFLPCGYARSDGSRGLGVWSDRSVIRVRPLENDPGHPVIDRMYLDTGVLRTDYPVVLRFSDGTVEHQFVGAITSVGLYQSVREIPVVRRKVAGVLKSLGLEEDSYSGLQAIELLQTYPLYALFALDVAELSRRVSELLAADTDRSLRLFARVGADGHNVGAMVFMPRDRYSTRMRTQTIEILEQALGGEDTEFSTRISQAPLAQLHLQMRLTGGNDRPDLSTNAEFRGRLQEQLAETLRSWDDRVLGAVADAPAVAGLIGSVSTQYREERDPAAAAHDLVAAAVLRTGDLHVDLRMDDPAAWTFTLYLAGQDAALTDVLPMLQSLGLTVIDEHPYALHRPDGVVVRVYEFAVAPAPHVVVDGDADTQQRVAEAFRKMWLGHTETDNLNELVLRAGLTCREVSLVRTYVRYLRQCGFSYSSHHAAEILGAHREVTRDLVGYFTASLDPAVPDDERDARRAAARTRLDAGLAEVLSLDADRVISALAATVAATLRTNYYRPESAGCTEIDDPYYPTIAIKLSTRDIPQAPEPRPEFEIFVHSPRVEGVHLRFGGVARGGCRWSDRREDFRTEILGLVKAQAVKNAVIVPVGAKGGFVVRRAPSPTGDAAADQAAYRAEGTDCYRAYVASLIQITDNLDHESGAIVPPEGVVRRDGDDPYLVMAADKGTASFSDTANAIAAHYGFWLGDAFASGGSVGYDHKAMGITARGAWEAVKRHFREMDVDTQTEDFTVVGIGDMSGDVFGNGMLLSEHIRLVAAFDHRHIFLDPDPDAASSFAERKRMFALPRSSWADYDKSLISEGGGVWSREQKSISVSPQVAAALGLPHDVGALSPPELIRAVLLAPVDLLFNGGIGTYVKASTESSADVGDKANDTIRVNGNQLRAKVVGEGGNLGVTERGRIEADLSGVRINSDALDNSAGVDCSDHEVNIKILLASQVSSGGLVAADRDSLLASMTGEVAHLVLDDNVAQNAELGCARSVAGNEADLYGRLLRQLARDGVDLELEALPTPKALAARKASDLGRGLTSPELATVMAHVKLNAKGVLLTSALGDNEFFDSLALDYFPGPLRERFADGIKHHRLHREIVITQLVNHIVDDGGMTYLYRMAESTTAGTEDAVRAYVVAARVFGLAELIGRIRAADVPVSVIDKMTVEARELTSRAGRWLLEHRPQPLAIAADSGRYARAAELTDRIEVWARPTIADAVDLLTDQYVGDGADPGLARDVARNRFRLHLLDVLDVAEITDRDPEEVGDLAFAVLEHYDIDELLAHVNALPRVDRWHLLARLALRDDLHSLVRAFTLAILEMSDPEESSELKIAEWESSRSTTLARVHGTLTELKESGDADFAALTVAVRALRSVV